MSKSKSKSPAAKSRSGHPARRTSDGASVFEQPVRNAMARYAAQLRAFFNERHTAADTEAGIEGLVTLLTVHSRLRNQVSVTELEHDALAIQFGDLRAIGEDVAIACASILKEFVLFLAETGLWSGTVEEFKAVFELISAQSGESPIVVPELDEATADEKWSKLPMVATARQLLAWVGEGRAVQPNGLLKESELVSAAAAIGIDVVFDADAQPESFRWVPEAGTAVGSLAHLPKLGAYWDALLRAGMLTKQDDKAVPTPGGGGSARSRLRVQRPWHQGHHRGGHLRARAAQRHRPGERPHHHPDGGGPDEQGRLQQPAAHRSCLPDSNR